MADIIPTYFLYEHANGNIDFNSDTFKWALCYGSYDSSFLYNVSSYSQLQTYELSAGNGYVTGGVQTSGSTSINTTTNVVVYNSSNPLWICSGGPIGPFRYAAMYDVTASDTVVYIYDPLELKTVEDGGTITISINSAGLMTSQQRV